MYCKYCGKQVYGQINICEDCYKRLNPDTQNVYAEYFLDSIKRAEEANAAPPKPTNANRKEGFNKALASAIIGAITLAISYPTCAIFLLLLVSAAFSRNWILLILALLFQIFLLVSIAFGIRLGIKAITAYVNEKSQSERAYRPALVLGIIGVAANALAAIIYIFITLSVFFL